MATQGQNLTDGLASFERGMNGGLHPSLIKQNQIAYGLNLTVRGGYARNRPPITRQLQIAWPSNEVKTAIQSGLFQGAWVYVPDTGSTSLITSISGRIYKWTVVGNVVTVSDVSPSDPNPATTTQCWAWQAEKWLIINNGIDLPLFFDGTSTRRSYGPAVDLGTANSGPANAPAIGDVITVTLASPYTGPYDIPVLFNQEYYQPTRDLTGYTVNLTTVYNINNNTHVAGTQVLIQPGLAGYLTQAASVSAYGSYAPGVLSKTFKLSTPFTGAIGSSVSITGLSWSLASVTIAWRVNSISGNTITATNIDTIGFGGFDYAVGTPVQIGGANSNNVVVGQLVADLAKTNVGVTTKVTLTRAFTGAAGQIVTIDGSQYSIESTTDAITPPGANDLYLVNLSDAANTSITYPITIVSVPELPAGRMGAYGDGQNWMSLVDGRGFIVSDISRAASGTQANDYRDSVLKTTEITFGGGAFAIPAAGSAITSMTFTAKLDESLGQGPLQIGTTNGMYAVATPFDFQNLPPLGTPILPQVLRGKGPIAQNSTIVVNSDTFFRNADGIATFIQARRDFASWGNAGASDEVNERLLDLDDESLLSYGSAIEFDNRVLYTISPQVSNSGVFHAGLVVINNDPISSLAGKTESVYDGLWTGLNTLALLTGVFDGTSRAFAFSYNASTAKIELYELLTTKEYNQFDNGYIPITWGFESATLFRDKPDNQLIRLLNGQFRVDNVLGAVRFKVWYRFDSDCWRLWNDCSICASGSNPQLYPRIGLGEPNSDDCNAVTRKPSREGYQLQVKFQITGRCRFLGAEFSATPCSEAKFQEPTCGVPQCVTNDCVAIPDLEVYSLQTNINFNGVPYSYAPPLGIDLPTTTYPPETIVIPPIPDDDPPNTVYYVAGCLSQIAYTNTPESIAAMYEELLRQASICAANNGNSGSGNGDGTGSQIGGNGNGGTGITTPPGQTTIYLSNLE